MAETAQTPVIEARGLTKWYGKGPSQVKALDGVDLTIERGEMVAIVGASGSGKSTLMNILGCLDVPDAGTYLLDGAPVGQLTEGRLAYLRSRSLGFVFQSYNLLPRLTALANVELPMAYAGVERAERRKRAIAALEMLSLVDRAGHRPAQLSGGQAQRVAVARALVNTPAVILADEPTGNLDSASAAEVLDALAAVNRRGRTVLLITHDAAVAKRADRCITLFDGRVATDSGSKT